MAEKCIASTEQYIYKRNFNENKWQDVGNGACRIQIKRRNNNYTLHIRLPGTDGGVSTSNGLCSVNIR